MNETFAKYGPNEALAVSSSQHELWIQKANYDIFTNWMNNQSSEEDAYVLLRDALIGSRLKLLAREILYTGRKALTDDHLQALCVSLTEKDLSRLVSEMGTPLQDVEETFEDSRPDKTPTRSGIFEILTTWLMAQKSPEEAHDALTTTLKLIGLKLVAELMNSNCLEILLKNPDLTSDRISTEKQPILRAESESRESKVAEPNPLHYSALATPDSVPTPIPIPDPKCFVAPDSELLSASEILEIESTRSSEFESTIPCHPKVAPKFSFLPDSSFLESDLEPISHSIVHCFLKEPSSHLHSEDFSLEFGNLKYDVVYHRLQVEHNVPITEPNRQNPLELRQMLSEADTQKASEADKQKALEVDEQKESEVDKQKASEADKQKASEADKQKASEADKQKASEADKQKASEADKQKASEADKQKASEADKQKASEADKQKASEADKQKASEADKQKASEAHKQKASEAEKQKAFDCEQERNQERKYERIKHKCDRECERFDRECESFNRERERLDREHERCKHELEKLECKSLELERQLKSIKLEKLAQEKLAQEKLAQEQIAQEKLAQAKLAQEKLAQEKHAQEQIAQEKLAQEKLTQEKLAQDKHAQEKLEQRRLAKEKLERKKIEDESKSKSKSKSKVREPQPAC